MPGKGNDFNVGDRMAQFPANVYDFGVLFPISYCLICCAIRIKNKLYDNMPFLRTIKSEILSDMKIH